MTVGERIRNARKNAGLTQKQLGEKCGIAEPTIRRYELGKLNPKYETLKKIASALEVPISYLIGSPPFADLKLLDESKSIILSSLFEKGLCNSSYIDDVSDFEYIKLVSDNIVNIEKKADNKTLSIYYKTTASENAQKQDDIKYVTGRLKIDIEEKHINLLVRFNLLNSKGQNKAMEQITDLTKIPEYRKDKQPPK